MAHVTKILFMKALKIIGHPVLIISIFLLILISGQAFGGPYLLYLILGLPHGATYAVSGFVGLVCLFISYKIYRGEPTHWIKPALALTGIGGLLYSLYVFFADDRLHYNYSTFEQSVPLLSLILFGVSIACGIVISVFTLIEFISKKDNSSVDSVSNA